MCLVFDVQTRLDIWSEGLLTPFAATPFGPEHLALVVLGMRFGWGSIFAGCSTFPKPQNPFDLETIIINSYLFIIIIRGKSTGWRLAKVWPVTFCEKNEKNQNLEIG